MAIEWLKFDPDEEEFPNEEEYSSLGYDRHAVHLVYSDSELERDEVEKAPVIKYEGDLSGFLDYFQGDVNLVFKYINDDESYRRWSKVRKGERRPGPDRADELPLRKYDIVNAESEIPEDIGEELNFIWETLHNHSADPRIVTQIQNDGAAGFIDIEDAEFQISHRRPRIFFQGQGIAGIRYEEPVEIYEYHPEPVHIRDEFLKELDLPDIYEDNSRFERDIRAEIAEAIRDDREGEMLKIDLEWADDLVITPQDWEIYSHPVKRELTDKIAAELEKKDIDVKKKVYGREVIPKEEFVFPTFPHVEERK